MTPCQNFRLDRRNGVILAKIAYTFNHIRVRVGLSDECDMFQVFDIVASTIVRKGNLFVIDPAGQIHRYGDGTGTPAGMKINSRASAKLVTDPDLYLGECYMNGDLEVTEGSIYDILSIFLSNARTDAKRATLAAKLLHFVRLSIKRLDQFNPAGRSKSNVAHHYDLSGTLYDLFLDTDLQYSCAYFGEDNWTLEDAQLAKKRHIAAKLMIRPGMKVLDIGSGWGGLALYLAEVCGAKVVGVTLSEEQFALSRKRVEDKGFADRIKILLKDYRNLDQTFDRVVSVGMFEHVGVGYYKTFFAKVNDLLEDDGIALLHSINRSDGPGATSAWIKRYIFPGGYIPALSEVVPVLERSGLYVTDVEILRLHYAETIRVWAERFAANRDRAAQLYDERFCRMWEYYLAISECAFRYGGMNNFQIQFVKDQHVLPQTRNYMNEEELRLRSLDSRPFFKRSREQRAGIAGRENEARRITGRQVN